MKNVISYYDDSTTFHSTLEDIPILTAADLSPSEILIKVSVAGSNPKDFKHPHPAYFNNKLNQGDDCAGTVAAVGSKVLGFRPGDRVAGFHHLDWLYGTYAEYTICPSNTVFHLPDNISDEEAATIPLTAYTAAVGLYRNLRLPAPWDRGDAAIDPIQEKIPLVVNGASSAVGSFAIKLAKMNPRIGPIIAVAGASADYVRQELGIDTILDYRSPSIEEDLKKALGEVKLNYVFDSANSVKSIKYLSSVLERGSGRYTCTMAFGDGEKILKDAGVWHERIWVGDVFGTKITMKDGTVVEIESEDKVNGVYFGSVMSRVFEAGLVDGSFRGHPFQVVEGGLDGVEAVLMKLGAGNRGNKKFVTKIADTKGLDASG